MKRSDFIKTSTGLIVGAASLSSFTNAVETNTEAPIIPRSLKRGDTIGITAPSGAIWNKSHIDKVQKILRAEGFKTLLGKTLYEQDGYLAGNDELRARELMEMYGDKNISAILTMRGGWGCARILDQLDYAIIRDNPKIIIGFSDITSLINAIYQKTNTITFHGPCGYSSWGGFTMENVLQTLVSGRPFEMKNPSNYAADLKTWTKGKARGRLIGGNLTVICSMIGTEFEPNWEGNLLFLEEIGEEPYRIDRMLWQLKQNGVYDKINGLILGSFKDCNPEEPEKSFSLDEVFSQHFSTSKFPVYQGAAIGHIAPKFTVPIGVMAEMNADNWTINTLEKCSKL